MTKVTLDPNDFLRVFVQEMRAGGHVGPGEQASCAHGGPRDRSVRCTFPRDAGAFVQETGERSYKPQGGETDAEVCVLTLEEPIVLYALSPIDDSKFCEICLKPSQTVKHAKHWLALRMPGLKVENIIVAKEKPSEKTHGQGLRNFPANWILEDEVRLRDTPSWRRSSRRWPFTKRTHLWVFAKPLWRWCMTLCSTNLKG
eukprot:g33760.t1